MNFVWPEPVRSELRASFVGPEAATLRLLGRVEDGASAVRRSASLGISRELAANTAGSSRGPWRLSKSIALSQALSNAFFDSLGASEIGP
jgi:hypothetical protein